MKRIFPVLLLAALASPSYAGIMYTVDNNTSTLMKIDTSTLAITSVGSLGVTFQYGDLAWDSANQTLYMIDGRGSQSLYTVNTTTGAATLVGAHGLTDLFALAFDSSTNKMYAEQFTSPAILEQMNLTTGAATSIGVGIAGTRIGAMAYDSKTDQLIGLEDCLGCAKLWLINRTTGAGTLLKGTGLDTNNSGMTYDPVLDRLWDVDVNGRLSFFDPSSGFAQTSVKTFDLSLDGLAYVTGTQAVPEPATFVFVGCGILGLLTARRARRRA